MVELEDTNAKLLKQVKTLQLDSNLKDRLIASLTAQLEDNIEKTTASYTAFKEEIKELEKRNTLLSDKLATIQKNNRR
jgi:hypothetical protein